MSKEELKNELLYQMQTSFPMTNKPFLHLAQKFNTSEDEILNLVKELKEQKIIRQTSAIFDTKRLGYKSSLVAFKVDKENIEKAVEAINSHPGVSHNYLRDHDFNIWFTIAVEPTSQLGLEKTVKLLAKQSDAIESIIVGKIILSIASLCFANNSTVFSNPSLLVGSTAIVNHILKSWSLK